MPPRLERLARGVGPAAAAVAVGPTTPAARLFAMLFCKMGQPTTVGEIAAGLIIGPSALGKPASDLFNAIFTPHSKD